MHHNRSNQTSARCDWKTQRKGKFPATPAIGTPTAGERLSQCCRMQSDGWQLSLRDKPYTVTQTQNKSGGKTSSNTEVLLGDNNTASCYKGKHFSMTATENNSQGPIYMESVLPNRVRYLQSHKAFSLVGSPVSFVG